MRKEFILILCVLSFLFSCNNDNILESSNFRDDKTEEIDNEKDLTSKTVEALQNKYGDAIREITKDVVYYDEASTYGGISETPELEIAFPYKKRDVVTFKTGNTIEVVDTFFIFQGDMLLNEEQIASLAIDMQENDTEMKTRGSILNNSKYKWGEIGYSFDRNFGQQHIQYVREAIAEWKNACPYLNFVDYSGYSGTGVFDCLIFYHDPNGGSFSYIGKQSYFQKISIATWGDKGTAMHEIGHALGLIHEHTRIDRDTYITVDINNVKKDKQHNYNKVSGHYFATDGLSLPVGNIGITAPGLDFNSLMMYSSDGGDFAIDPNKPVMVKKSDGSRFRAQRSYIGTNDAAAIRMFYVGR